MCACDECFDKPIDESRRSIEQANKKRLKASIAKANRLRNAVAIDVSKLVDRAITPEEEAYSFLVTLAVIDILARLAEDKRKRKKRKVNTNVTST